MTNEHRANENHLLRVLPDPEWARLAVRLILVDVPMGQVIYESGASVKNVCFPTTSVVSMLHLMHDGTPAEIAIVQSAGQAYRLDARILKEEFDRAGLAQRLLLRYTHQPQARAPRHVLQASVARTMANT